MAPGLFAAISTQNFQHRINPQKMISITPVLQTLIILAFSFFCWCAASTNPIFSGRQESDTVSIPLSIPPIMINRKDQIALAQTIYFESRGEPTEGQEAVAFVVMNRLHSKSFPNTIPEIVFQKDPVCQFSWTCNPKINKNKINDESSWKRALAISSAVLADEVPDPVPGALYFHRRRQNPSSSHRKTLERSRVIEHHIFSPVILASSAKEAHDG